MKRMYLICNAHIDPMWQWEWTEGVGTALSNASRGGGVCEKNDAFVFNHNESLLYQWIEEYEPELFRRIEALVRQGRWHIMGGWFVQPDCNIPHGESIVRQISTGRRYFREKVRRGADHGDQPRPVRAFPGIVQIMAKSGYDSYIICRPFHPVPGADRFVWKGFEEAKCAFSGCPACAIAARAGGQAHSGRDGAADRGRKRRRAVGVGNHGGGPSQEDLEKIGAMMEASGTWRLCMRRRRSSSPPAGEEDWPVYEKSLHHTMVGCYSSQVRIKQQHRRLENELLAAEKCWPAHRCRGWRSILKRNWTRPGKT